MVFRLVLQSVAVGAAALFFLSACGAHSQGSVTSVPAVAQARVSFASARERIVAPPVALVAPQGAAPGFALDAGTRPPFDFAAVAITFSDTLIADNGTRVAAFAKRYGVRTFFLPVAAQDVTNLLDRDPATVRNLQALFDAGNVFMLAGDAAWLANPGRMPALADDLSRRIGPMYPRFAGILYDVEPQADPEWDRNRQGAIDRYFALLDTLLASRRPATFRATVVATIPGYARQPDRSGRKSMLQGIEAYHAVDATFMLMDGNSAADQLARAAPAFPQMTKPYFAVANTSPNVHAQGYGGSTPRYFVQNMRALGVGARGLNPNLRAVAVSAWDDRENSLQAILPQPTPSPNPDPEGRLVPPRGTDYIGAYVDPNDAKPGPGTTAAFEAEIGRRLAYDIHYFSWDSTFPGRDEDDDVAKDRIPLLSWNCGDFNSNIARGDDDPLIKARAADLRAFGHPVFLRYEWEMNLKVKQKKRAPCYDPKTDLRSGYFSPKYFIAAWRHIHDIFEAEGAKNVVWLWNPGGGGPDPSQYYPGKKYVDWTGLDQYDRKNFSFEDTFFPDLDILTQFGKPVMVVETGALANHQTAFFRPSAETLERRYPYVRAFSYLDADSGTNWSLTPQGIADFRALAHTRLMSAHLPH